MKLTFKQFGSTVAVAGAVGLLICAGLGAAGARFNSTKSLPKGLYWTSSKPVAKGDHVIFCPPQIAVFDEAKKRGYIGAGFCQGNYGYMMKRVLAAKGDSVSITNSGVIVNGEPLPNSTPFDSDKSGRPMPRHEVAQFVLGDNEVLLMTDSPVSFDARYFGPVARVQLQSVIEPVLTW